jgi:ectoine hydroxylase-related dioxygenase (phytanoyl-CoA dioxygenase family)
MPQDSSLHFYRKNGYIVVNGIFTNQDLLSAHEALEELRDTSASRSNIVRWGAAGKPVFIKVPQVFQKDERFLNMARHPLLIAEVEKFIGETSIFRDVVVEKPAQDGSVVFPHQDCAYWDIEKPENALSAWIALDDVESHSGGLQVVPGSQRQIAIHHLYLGKLRLPLFVTRLLRRSVSLSGTGDSPRDPVQRFFQYLKKLILGSATKFFPTLNTLGELQIDLKDYPNWAAAVMLTLKAGDVILFDSRLCHLSGLNTSTNVRRAYIVSYVGKGL